MPFIWLQNKSYLYQTGYKQQKIIHNTKIAIVGH